MNNIFSNHYCGNFQTRTFGDIYATPYDDRPEAEGKIGEDYFDFHYNHCGLTDRLLSTSDFEEGSFEYDNISKYDLEAIYILLLSRYADSHIKSWDEDKFKLQVDSIIWINAPEWQRAMLNAEKKAKLSADDIKGGSSVIYNHAKHPGKTPSTQTLEELTYIDDQNTTKYKKSDIDALAGYNDLPTSTATENFLKKFSKLFKVVVRPAGTQLFVTEV